MSDGDEEATYICDGCGQKIDFDGIKLITKGGGVLCPDCFREWYKLRALKELAMQGDNEEEGEEEGEGETFYICENCGRDVDEAEGEQHQCGCRFCTAARALDEIEGRNLGVDAQVETIRETLNGLWDELFEDQFALDTIATRLGIPEAIGVQASQIEDQVAALQARLTAAELELGRVMATDHATFYHLWQARAEAAEAKNAALQAQVDALMAVPFEYCRVGGEHDPTHTPRHFCRFQLADYALKVLALLYGVDADNPTNEQLNRVPRTAGKNAGWLEHPSKTADRIRKWIKKGAELS